MKRFLNSIKILTLLVFTFYACSTSKQLHDQESMKRQKEIKNTRSSNVFSDILGAVFSIFTSNVLDTEMDWEPTEKQFKKINFINPSDDTLFVNMLTDVLWDNEDYCDFLDIRIPPRANCKLMLPINTNYNLYFSNTPEPDDDEMLEISTNDFNKISLYPGLTKIDETKKN